MKWVIGFLCAVLVPSFSQASWTSAEQVKLQSIQNREEKNPEGNPNQNQSWFKKVLYTAFPRK